MGWSHLSLVHPKRFDRLLKIFPSPSCFFHRFCICGYIFGATADRDVTTRVGRLEADHCGIYFHTSTFNLLCNFQYSSQIKIICCYHYLRRWVNIFSWQNFLRLQHVWAMIEKYIRHSLCHPWAIDRDAAWIDGGGNIDLIMLGWFSSRSCAKDEEREQEKGTIDSEYQEQYWMEGFRKLMMSSLFSLVALLFCRRISACVCLETLNSFMVKQPTYVML